MVARPFFPVVLPFFELAGEVCHGQTHHVFWRRVNSSLNDKETIKVALFHRLPLVGDNFRIKTIQNPSAV